MVHPWGLDVSKVPPPLPREKRDPVILSVGRLVPVKGFHLVVEALKGMKISQHVVWRVFGDGPQRAFLERMAKQSGINVEFLGAQPHREVLQAMRRALLLVGPSIPLRTGEEEGFGMVFLEAMAQGTPVVATRSGGIPEVVVNGRTGLLVPPGDVQALRNAIARLLGDTDLWALLSFHARARVEKMFTLDRHIDILEKIYDNVVEDTRERSMDS